MSFRNNEFVKLISQMAAGCSDRVTNGYLRDIVDSIGSVGGSYDNSLVYSRY